MPLQRQEHETSHDQTPRKVAGIIFIEISGVKAAGAAIPSESQGAVAGFPVWVGFARGAASTLTLSR
jgi:hypothetical protein